MKVLRRVGQQFVLLEADWEPQTLNTVGLTLLERLFTRLWPCMLWTGGVGCPVLRRWTVVKGARGGLYVHHFIGDDWSKDLHDHSGRMVSIGLWGSYEEETPEGKRVWRAPWVRTFPATWTHRLRLVTKSVWTVIWVGPKERGSGYWFRGRWWHKDIYEMKVGRLRKSC